MVEPKRRRVWLRMAAALAAVPLLLTSACSGSSLSGDDSGAEGGTLKIGLLVAQSGTYKAIGDDLKRGFELYLALNGNKLGGHKVEVVLADEGETGESGRAAAEKLIKQDKVDVITGIVSSAVLPAVADLANKEKVPLIVSNAGTPLKDYTYVWRSGYLNDEPDRSIGAYVAKNTPGTVYLLASNYKAGYDHLNGFKDTFLKAGGKIEAEEYTPFPKTPNFTSYLQKVKQSGAKAIYCFYAGSAAVQFVKEFKAYGLHRAGVKLYGSFLTEGTLKALGQDAEGVYTPMNYSADLDNPANRVFAAEYQKRHGDDPTAFAMTSYDAGLILDTALKNVKELTPENIRDAINKAGRFDNSPRGPWEFNKNHSPVQKWYLRQVQTDGQRLANVVIEELATLG